ncbi:hypothetical protein [Salmonirosea aquatica]|uniref:Uncharacterized protein n=1 Tax=Salmonirosea aquatica TaxID=2654236 RepID=A0A7C9F6A8_9BACT|nr:hypothetical protein [Cytophagaceae bacterium SJW1-29]
MKLEFFNDNRVKLTNTGTELNGYFGYIDNDLVIYALAEPGENGEVRMYGKELNKAFTFSSFKMGENFSHERKKMMVWEILPL